MADLADYLEILASRGLKEEDVVPLVGDASEELEEKILPALRQAYANAIAGDSRISDPEAFLQRRMDFAKRAFYQNANELLRRKLKRLLRDL
ncbi:MAG: hypothetical protein KDA22_11495, partial [Phycisphaerales bacterium]|nr:hypothetical protein [Phycisphaerales bacterium]